MYQLSYLPSQIWWYGIPNLYVLLGSVSHEEIIIRERLQTCGFSYRKASTLERIWMYEVVAIFRNVAGYGRGRFLRELHTEAVIECAGTPVSVIGY